MTSAISLAQIVSGSAGRFRRGQRTKRGCRSVATGDDPRSLERKSWVAVRIISASSCRFGVAIGFGLAFALQIHALQR
jgi:hypothetical protein